MKKLIVIVITLIMFITPSLASANTIKPEDIPPGPISDDPNMAIFDSDINAPMGGPFEVGIMSTDPFDRYGCRLAKGSTTGTMYIEGFTTAKFVVPELGFTLILQVYENNTWKTLGQRPFTRYNMTSFISGEFVTGLPLYRYYRLLATHRIYYNGKWHYKSGSTPNLYLTP